MITRPMKAEKVKYEHLEGLEWPLLVSPKIDGIRSLMHPEIGPATTSFIQVPNTHIYETLKRVAGNCRLDGELVAVHEDGDIRTFNETQSAVMSHGGRPLFMYLVFDCFRQPDEKFLERYTDATFIVESMNHPSIRIVNHKWVANVDEFLRVAQTHISQGFEGTMIRSFDGPYKSGRSTLKQGWLLKYKAWADAEGTVVGFEERMHNANEDIKDNFGHAKRSSHKENMVPMGTLGALILDTAWGELRVGTGFDDALRQEIWNRNMDMSERYRNKDSEPPDVGRKVTFKYQEYGMQDKPRFPVFKGFREDE
ncbi:hypothetical protein LCGC14_0481630 [marine sediment metagenome]|uniref:ATP-dependent DNA ligase family profile domain-containing protein n=1 Tax=marine sediment metagenome TaxID=412755 RepID=A0A0F9VHZ8_9ZZZZ